MATTTAPVASEAQEEFLGKEAWGGIALVIMAGVALIVAKSPL